MQTIASTHYFDPTGFFGFLNLRYFKIFSSKNPLNRPKYPPTNPSPIAEQVFKNMNMSDIGLSTVLYLFSSVFSYTAATIMIADAPVKLDQINFLVLKMYCTRAIKFSMVSMIPVVCFLHSYMRLTGQVYNGQEWQFKQNRFQIFSAAPVAIRANAEINKR